MEVLSKGAEAETLPPEILAFIFQYLSVKDVTQCAKVCVKWREETNRNELWKQFCVLKGWADGVSLSVANSIPPRVEPYFLLREPCQDSRLSTLSVWHVHYIQFHHLYRNWRNGNYVIQKLDHPCFESLGDITAIDLTPELVVLGSDNGIVTFWKLAQNEVEFLEQVLCVFQDAVISNIFFEEMHFVVLQLGLLQIYRRGVDRKYSLCCVKAMVPHNVQLPDLIGSWPVQRAVDSYFLENIYDCFEDEKFEHSVSHNNSLIAFWGTVRCVEVLSLKPSGFELKTLNLHFENYSVRDVAIYDPLIFIVLAFNVIPSIIIEYSLEKNCCIKQYMDSLEVTNISVGDQFVVSFDKTGLFSVWHRVKGEKIHVLKYPDHLPPNTNFEVVHNTLHYHSQITIGTVIHFSSQSQLHEMMTIESTSRYLAKAMGDLYVLQQGCDVEVWSRREKSKLYHLENILIKEHPYTAECLNFCVVLCGLNIPPTYVWFW